MNYPNATSACFPTCAQKNMKRQPYLRGFTLIEVLVTVVVVSIGMLSIAQLQVRSLQHSHSSLQRTVATVQANDLLERMWSGYCDTTEGRDEDVPAFHRGIFLDWLDAASANPLLPGLKEETTLTIVDPTASNPAFRLFMRWEDSRSRDDTTPTFEYIFRMVDADLLSC